MSGIETLQFKDYKKTELSFNPSSTDILKTGSFQELFRTSPKILVPFPTSRDRRHIEGSKIAKGLQNVKVLVNCEPLNEKHSKKVSQCRKN